MAYSQQDSCPAISEEMAFEQELGDLDGVGGGVFADIVADAPEVEGIRLAEILAIRIKNQS